MSDRPVVARSRAALAEALAAARRRGRVGFVPTMGALHEGHLSLVRASVESCEVTVVSVFVNPTQFGPAEDFAAYPREWASDLAALAAAGVGVVFHPPEEES